METKPLLYAIIGFLLGGLVVSIAATQDDDTANASETTMSQMSEDLADTTGDDFDAAFITAMIEHHEGAIDMARLAESRAEHDALERLARTIISAQEAEIAEMKQWQQEWGYSG